VLVDLISQFTCNLDVGVTQIQTFQELKVKLFNLLSRSNIQSTILFQEVDVSPLPVHTLSAVDNQPTKAYATDKITIVEKNTTAQIIDFFIVSFIKI